MRKTRPLRSAGGTGGINDIGGSIEARSIQIRCRRLVWVIDPAKAKAIVYRSLTDVTELQAGDHLDGGDVLPGFRCRLSDIF